MQGTPPVPARRRAHAALERIDAEVGEVVAAGRAVEPDLVVAIVSDHGFAPVEHDTELGVAFVEAGADRARRQGRAGRVGGGAVAFRRLGGRGARPPRRSGAQSQGRRPARPAGGEPELGRGAG